MGAFIAFWLFIGAATLAVARVQHVSCLGNKRPLDYIDAIVALVILWLWPFVWWMAIKNREIK